MNHKRISKKMGITIFCLLAGIMALIIVLHHNPFADPQEEMVKKIIACVLIVVSCIIFIIFYDKLTVLPVELFENRRLIWKLAKNDFKKRYAGSYLGIIWALVQPVVTVVMYWFVFENFMGSKAQFLSSGTSMPYVLFLAAGLCAASVILIGYIRLQAENTVMLENIAKKESTLNSMKMENDEEYSRIISSVDLEYIKDVAINQLGMRYAEEGQIVEVETQGDDYVRQHQKMP